jgi:hypothetical protein
MRQPIELHHMETLSGAACYQPIELQYYKAAPLQAVGFQKLVRHSQILEDEDENDSCGHALPSSTICSILRCMAAP